MTKVQIGLRAQNGRSLPPCQSLCCAQLSGFKPPLVCLSPLWAAHLLWCYSPLKSAAWIHLLPEQHLKISAKQFTNQCITFRLSGSLAFAIPALFVSNLVWFDLSGKRRPDTQVLHAGFLEILYSLKRKLKLLAVFFCFSLLAFFRSRSCNMRYLKYSKHVDIKLCICYL